MNQEKSVLPATTVSPPREKIPPCEGIKNPHEETPGLRHVIIITGMSGAGKSSALKVCEDLGHEAVDNLPLRLLGGLVDSEPIRRPLALGVDIRTRDFDVSRLLHHIRLLRQQRHLSLDVLFLEADDDTLINRFTETRRRHPIGDDLPLIDGIAIERSMLRALREQSDGVLDSSCLSLNQLRTLLQDRFATATSPSMTLLVTSFGFRNGLPRSADLVFDVRFLRNPQYDPDLRPLTGRDARVRDYVMADPAADVFLTRLTSLLDCLFPLYEKERKIYLTIAIGCTGGKHRSVATVEWLARWLAETGRHVLIRHRDIPDMMEGKVQ